MKSRILIIGVTLANFACNNTSTDRVPVDLGQNAIIVSEVAASLNVSEPAANEMVKYTPPVIKDDDEDNTVNYNETKEKKIIKDGRLSLKTKNIESCKTRIDSSLKYFKAYYEEERLNKEIDKISYSLKVRIPEAKFDEFLKYSEEGIGEVVFKDINTRDVTEDFTDTETRLESKRVFRKRYYDLLSKAARVDDILAIEENIRNLQEEIESKEGHLKYINDQVKYSTLTLNIYCELAVQEKPVKKSFGSKLITSLEDGWNAVVNFVLWLITVWPLLILIGVVIILIARLLKRRKNRNNET